MDDEVITMEGEIKGDLEGELETKLETLSTGEIVGFKVFVTEELSIREAEKTFVTEAVSVDVLDEIEEIESIGVVLIETKKTVGVEAVVIDSRHREALALNDSKVKLGGMELV